MEDKVTRILLVEDNTADAFFLREALKESAEIKFEVTQAEYLNEALKSLEKNSFDAVILDLSLPDSMGTDTFLRLHQRFPDIPVIVSTGLSDEDAATKVVREGAQDYLVKGQMDKKLVVRSIRYAIERKSTEKRILATNSLLELFAGKSTRKEYLDSVVYLLQKWSRCEGVGIRLVQENFIPYESYVGFTVDFWEKENWLNLCIDHCACVRVVRGMPEPQDLPFITPGGSFLCVHTNKLVESLSENEKNRFRGECIRTGYLTVAVVPIRYRNEIIGAIHLADKGSEKILLEQISFIESAGLLIGEAIHRFNVEKALQESSELLERMFSNIHLLVAYMDTQFNYIRVNRAFAELAGHTEKFFVGKNHFELMPNRENEEIFKNVITTGKPAFVFSKPFGNKTDSHEIKYWDWSLQAIKEPNGKVIGVILSLLNVTERMNLVNELLEISHREQRRIGQDLHDVLGQNLTGIAFLAKALERKLKGKSNPESSNADKLVHLVNQAIIQARALARGLCPVELKADGLMMAIQEFAANIEHLFNIKCEFKCEKPIFIQDNNAAINLYHIVQEAVNNAIKHGKAKNISITMEFEDGLIALVIKDDGIGLPDNISHKGMGLQIMNYRARMIDAAFKAQRAETGGTIVKCSFNRPMQNKRK